MGTNVVWTTPNTFQLFDRRTNTKYQVGVPYADEVGFYSEDELEDIIGHAVERFERECADKPTHIVGNRDFQHGLGKTLDEIKTSRENRKEIGGPKYPLIVPAHLARR